MKRKDYCAPDTTVFEVETRSVLCESGDITNMAVLNAIDGDADFE